jgi:hypothetical protein
MNWISHNVLGVDHFAIPARANGLRAPVALS